MITIHPFEKVHQLEVNEMMRAIDSEFEISIFNPNQPTDPSIDNYWIAKHHTEIVGTIKVIQFDADCAVLKSMFVKKEFRGKELGTAQLLLTKVYDWCSSAGISHIYLGTMSQFKAAHKFYEKNGFNRILKKDLPNGFVNNSVDNVFFVKTLQQPAT